MKILWNILFISMKINEIVEGLLTWNIQISNYIEHNLVESLCGDDNINNKYNWLQNIDVI